MLSDNFYFMKKQEKNKKYENFDIGGYAFR